MFHFELDSTPLPFRSPLEFLITPRLPPNDPANKPVEAF